MLLLELLDRQLAIIDAHVRPTREHVYGCAVCAPHLVEDAEPPECPVYRALSSATEAAAERLDDEARRASFSTTSGATP